MAETSLHLFEGGPLESLWRRLGLDGFLVATLRIRHVLVWAVVWLPMLVLSLWQGVAVSAAPVGFLRDFEAQARFLVALPLLLMAQPFADMVFGMVLDAFVRRGIIRSSDEARFRSLLASAGRWSRGYALTLFVFGLLALANSSVAPDRLATAIPMWYGSTVGDALQLTAAGVWCDRVAIVVFQFVLCRWLLRLLIWWVLLLRIARLNLHLVATHPDGAGGLGILGDRIGAFTLFLLAQGFLLSGTLANRIAYQDVSLQQMWPEAAAYGAVVLVLILGPFMTLSRPMRRAKWRAKAEYDLLASRYVNEFEDKWIRGKAPAGEPLIGSADIQSLADLTGSLDVIRGMGMAPFGKEAIPRVLMPFLLPVFPLIFTMIPAADLLKGLVKIVL